RLAAPHVMKQWLASLKMPPLLSSEIFLVSGPPLLANSVISAPGMAYSCVHAAVLYFCSHGSGIGEATKVVPSLSCFQASTNVVLPESLIGSGANQGPPSESPKPSRMSPSHPCARANFCAVFQKLSSSARSSQKLLSSERADASASTSVSGFHPYQLSMGSIA